MKFLSYSLLLGISAMTIVSSCGSKKVITKNSPVEGEKLVNIPCAEFNSDKEFFRATQSSTSNDMSMARDKALLTAKNRLAGLIQSKLKSVMQTYRNERSAGAAKEYEDKYEQEARDIVDQTMNDVNVVCEKVTKSPDGLFNTYVAIEMRKDALVKRAQHKITNDDKLKIDYDEKKFREIFDKEMDALKNEIPD